jgi:hypothetical protein
MVLSTPFHAVLGLTIMQSNSLIAGAYYPSLHLAWSNPVSDQRVAGGILWAGGEIVSVVMLAALVAQWMRSSEKEARRVDRQLDREEAAAARRARARLASGDAVLAGDVGGDHAGSDAIDDDGDGDRAVAAEREREAAWTAMTGIPMMDEPVIAAATDLGPSGQRDPAAGGDVPGDAAATVMANNRESGAKPR